MPRQRKWGTSRARSKHCQSSVMLRLMTPRGQRGTGGWGCADKPPNNKPARMHKEKRHPDGHTAVRSPSTPRVYEPRAIETRKPCA